MTCCKLPNISRAPIIEVHELLILCAYTLGQPSNITFCEQISKVEPRVMCPEIYTINPIHWGPQVQDEGGIWVLLVDFVEGLHLGKVTSRISEIVFFHPNMVHLGIHLIITAPSCCGPTCFKIFTDAVSAFEQFTLDSVKETQAMVAI